jgi:hypothetical protein
MDVNGMVTGDDNISEESIKTIVRMVQIVHKDHRRQYEGTEDLRGPLHLPIMMQTNLP